MAAVATLCGRVHPPTEPCPLCRAMADEHEHRAMLFGGGEPRPWQPLDANGKRVAIGDRVRCADGRLGRVLTLADAGKHAGVRVPATKALLGGILHVDTDSLRLAPLRRRAP